MGAGTPTAVEDRCSGQPAERGFQGGYGWLSRHQDGRTHAAMGNMASPDPGLA